MSRRGLEQHQLTLASITKLWSTAGWLCQVQLNGGIEFWCVDNRHFRGMDITRAQSSASRLASEMILR